MRPLAQAAFAIRRLSEEARAAVLSQLTDEDLHALAQSWHLTARESQLRPHASEAIWFFQAGRGTGKTRGGSEERLDRMEAWGADYQGIVMNKTLGDVRRINVLGRSGLIACARARGYDLQWREQKRELRHPLGGVLNVCTPEEPDGPRGLECNDFLADEISSWRNAIETWNNLMYAWRLPGAGGERKTGTVTSTPKPNPITYLLLRDAAYRNRVTVTRGRTDENLANLDEDMHRTIELYRGTKLGRQETDGELLAMYTGTFEQDILHQYRVEQLPSLSRRVVSVDPAINDGPAADDAGVAVVGMDRRRMAHAYVLDTYAVDNHRDWPERVVRSFLEYNCDSVIAEINQGGAMIVDAIQVAAESVGRELGREIVVPVRSVWSQKSKEARAEPVGALSEKGRVHFYGHHTQAEAEITRWVPGMPSPNIMDAFVQGVSHLLLGESEGTGTLGMYDHA